MCVVRRAPSLAPRLPRSHDGWGRALAGLMACALVPGAACAGSDRLPVSDTSGSSAPGATSAGPGSGGAPGDGDDGEGAASEGGAPAAVVGTTTGGAGGGEGGDDPGAGGAPPEACGDGSVTGIEECDDGNATDDDGCSTCVVDCDAMGVKDPASGHCYRVFPDATTWPFAEANCQAWGGAPSLGHLASIGDAGEQALVFSLIVAQSWIGIQDPDVEGTYQWSDGTPWAYEAWAPGEPDNTNEEDCAFMRVTDAGGWNDHACGDLRPAYVCERRAAGSFD